jgi:hypothetical protein
MKKQLIIKKNNRQLKNPSNPVIYFFIYCYRWTLYFLFILYNRIFPKQKVIIIDPIKNYIDSNKNKLLSSFSIENMNNNIEKKFYDKKELLETLLDENNDLEKLWKTRILFENTPRGNIIMYYDAYKQGFAYYSDMTGIPYNILNAVAMRYVVLYRCRDFFVDNEYVDEQKESPLIKLYLEYEKNNEKKENTDKKKSDMIKQDDAPFAKLKNYKLTNTDVKKEKTDEPKPEKIYNRNLFIQVGKVSSFNFLQIAPKKNKLNGFKSKLLDGVESESNLQNEVMSYSKYKELLLKKKSE